MTRKLFPKNKYYLMVTSVLICAVLFTACAKKKQPPPVPLQAPKAAVVPPKPVQKQSTSALPPLHASINQLDFSNKKDPFKPFLVVKTEPKMSPESSKNTGRISLPIHSFDVSQFKLIGIITGGRENKAMVTDPGGKGYVLKVGMSIGKNDGRVVSINTSGVEVMEYSKNDSGRGRKESIKLTLPRKQ